MRRYRSEVSIGHNIAPLIMKMNDRLLLKGKPTGNLG